jgi:WD40 repeat protein
MVRSRPGTEGFAAMKMDKKLCTLRIGWVPCWALVALLGACGGGDDRTQSTAVVAAAPPQRATADAADTATVKRKVGKGKQRRGITAMDVAPDGSVAIAASDGSVRLGEAETARERSAVARAGGVATTAVAFSADGKQLVSVGRDSVARVWNVASGARLLSLSGHEHPVQTVAASADGAWFASAGQETRILVWNAATGKLARVLGGQHASFINAVAFSPDSRTLATGDANGTVVLWNLANGATRHRLSGQHVDEVNSLAFSPDGSLLATAAEDGRIVLWSVDTGQVVQVLSGHAKAVRALAFSRDGKWLASGGEELKVVIWDMTSRAQARSLPTGAGVNALVFDVPRRREVLFAGDEAGQVLRWDVKNGVAR